jgi:hypothetical protein
MNLNNFKLKIAELAAVNPEKSSDIWDEYFIAMDAIEDGGSISHETELALESIKQLIEEQ